jgi:broad specificity phosphatase PhoE
MPSRLVLLRHGATEWSLTGQHTGRTDIPLLEEGRRQAKAIGALLSAYRLTEFAQVLTSPLVRASETCALAGFEGETDLDLLEWDYGAYEGITTAEIRQTRPDWNLWSDGVPEGETAAEVGRRADRVVERAHSVDGDTLLVAHGHFLRVLAARWLGLPPAAGRLFMLDAGAICVLDSEHDLPAVRLWNLVAPPAPEALQPEG